MFPKHQTGHGAGVLFFNSMLLVCTFGVSVCRAWRFFLISGVAALVLVLVPVPNYAMVHSLNSAPPR